MDRKLKIRNSTAEFLTFTVQAQEDGIEVRLQDETIWLSQKLMGVLFECTTDNIGLHLKHIFQEGELEEHSVTEYFSATAADGKNYRTKFYNLDAIIAVGYRINSKKATAFRRWATNVLRDYTIRGYIIDKERMKNGTFFNEDYFKSLLEEVREIRASERLFYQKITDIYATSFDYDAESPSTINFFANVQNKLHFAIHHHTAAELIMDRAIMLSALGQIAMSTYYATEHEKEIGIRKIFGGTVESESRRNVREYMSYCLIAGIIAVPLSIWITGRYLETFVYRMQQSPWIYIAAVAALLVISLASVLWQISRAARTNPAEALKKE